MAFLRVVPSLVHRLLRPGRLPQRTAPRTKWQPTTVFGGVCAALTLTLAVAPISALAEPAAAPPAGVAGLPAGLPSHFGLGVAAPAGTTNADSWIGSQGLPWDYSNVVLNGGVNTGTGWYSWDPPGQYAAQFANSAAARGSTPIYTYAQLLQSAGPCDSCGEAQRYLANLNSPDVMGAYFQEFTALMQQLGTGAKLPAIVHVEPDLAGYAMQAANNDLGDDRCYGFCTGQGNDPSLVTAAVASSGVGQVAGFPNTYQGYNWALLHLRDLYAPNVMLAFHISIWTSGTDIGTNNEAWIDGNAMGGAAGGFARASGAGQAGPGTSSYDLLFDDVAPYSAGYAEMALGRNGMWWDPNNVDFPNFDRWEQFVAAASRSTGLPSLAWEVPFGVQSLHQDNRAEYFLGHLDELIQAGVIGLIFGDRNAAGSLDDDGGFLRGAVQQYRAQPRELAGAVGAAAAAGRVPRPPVQVTYSGSLGWRGATLVIQQTDILSQAMTLDVDVEITDVASGQRVWQTTRPAVSFDPGAPVDLSFTYPDAGSLPPSQYNVVVGLFSPSWKTLYSWTYVGSFQVGR